MIFIITVPKDCLTGNKMRFLYIILVLTLLFSLGCSKKEEPQIEIKDTKEIKSLLKDEEINENVSKVVDKVLKEKENLSKEDKDFIKEKVIEESDKILTEEIPDIPQIKLDTQDVKIEWNDKSGKLMSAVAKSFSGDQGSNTLTLNNFTAKLYENGVLSAKLQAKKAVLNATKKEIKVSTGVKITSLTNNSTLIANHVLWKSTENKVFAKEAILETPNGKIQGKYFKLDTKLETFEVNDKGFDIN